MREGIKLGLPEERNAAAKQVRRSRRFERTMSDGLEGMKIDRSAVQYIENLLGLGHFFEYVRSTGCPVVLDIGAGLGRAVKELAKTTMAQGVRLEGTILTRNQHMKSGDAVLHITSAENLRGISDASIGGVLALYSVGYSERARLVAQSIDRVLAPGGIFKGSFKSFKPTHRGGMTLKTADDTISAFRELRYDVATCTDTDSTILVAIKPASGERQSSHSLLMDDVHDRFRQRLSVKNQLAYKRQHE